MQRFTEVLVLGSGALKIGEAAEFDYSGSQAIIERRGDGRRLQRGGAGTLPEQGSTRFAGISNRHQ